MSEVSGLSGKPLNIASPNNKGSWGMDPCSQGNVDSVVEPGA